MIRFFKGQTKGFGHYYQQKKVDDDQPIQFNPSNPRRLRIQVSMHLNPLHIHNQMTKQGRADANSDFKTYPKFNAFLHKNSFESIMLF